MRERQRHAGLTFRSLSLVVATLALAAVASSCGGAGATGKAADAAAPVVDDLFRSGRSGPDDFAQAARRPPPTTLSPAAARLVEATERVAVSALCEGVAIILNNQAFTWDGWQEWAYQMFQREVIGFEYDLDQYFADTAGGVADVLTLVQESPQLALQYAKWCVGR